MSDPLIGLIGVIIGALAVGGFGVWQHRMDIQEARRKEHQLLVYGIQDALWESQDALGRYASAAFPESRVSDSELEELRDQVVQGERNFSRLQSRLDRNLQTHMLSWTDRVYLSLSAIEAGNSKTLENLDIFIDAEFQRLNGLLIIGKSDPSSQLKEKSPLDLSP